MKDGQYSHCPKPLPSYCHIVFSTCLSFSRLSQWKQRICYCNHSVPREGWKKGKGGRTDSMHLVTKLLPLQIFSWTLYQMTPAYTSVIFICQKDWALQNFDFVFAFCFLSRAHCFPSLSPQFMEMLLMKKQKINIKQFTIFSTSEYPLVLETLKI